MFYIFRFGNFFFFSDSLRWHWPGSYEYRINNWRLNFVNLLVALLSFGVITLRSRNYSVNTSANQMTVQCSNYLKYRDGKFKSVFDAEKSYDQLKVSVLIKHPHYRGIIKCDSMPQCQTFGANAMVRFWVYVIGRSWNYSGYGKGGYLGF